MSPFKQRPILSASLALLVLASCSSTPIAKVSPMDAGDVPPALAATLTSPASELGDSDLIDAVASLPMPSLLSMSAWLETL